MAPIKRKQPSEIASSKPANKRQKADGISAVKAPAKVDKENASPARPVSKPVASILVKEQAAFPRGGAGALTPIERKQIYVKASRAAATEQKRSGELFGDGKAETSETEEESDLELEDADLQQTFAKKKSSSKKTKAASKTTKERSDIAIEGLSYKRLTEGSLALGRVSAISSQDLTISLPNNLTGFVPLTSISDAFTRKIESALKNDVPNSEDEEEEEDDGEIALEDHFRIGQYLRVAVTSLSEESVGKVKAKKKIVLSITPELANKGLETSSLAIGCTIQAAVTSVEDHGLIMDVGLGKGTRGFIPSKSFKGDLSLSDIRVGAVLLTSVTNIGSNGKTIKLSPSLAEGTVLKTAPSVDTFLPGTLVEILLTDITHDGLIGKVMGLLDVTADIVHSGSFKDKAAFSTRFEIGQKVKGRLVCTFSNSDTKKVGVSLLPDTIDAVPAAQQQLKTSSIVEEARVLRVSPGLGVYLALPFDEFGFAHISRLADKQVDSISEDSGAYKVGSVHKARVLDHNTVDGLYIMSLEKSVIEQPFLRIDDVQIGQVVRATVTKILIGEAGVSGLILNLAEGVTGLVPSIHMSDITLLHPEKKFREGGVVSARVLSVNKDKRQLRLTLKKTLVNTDQKVWANFNDVTVGASTAGTLVKVDTKGALVQFYGSMRGFLPVSEMSEAYIKDASEHFKVGQVLTVTAISVNEDTNRLTLSCREKSASEETDLASLIAGTLATGIIFEKSQDDVLLRLQPSNAIARLTIDHVSDGSERKRQSAMDKLRVNQKLEDLLILEVPRKGRPVSMTNRQNLVKAAKDGEFLKGFEDLKEGSIYTGFVKNITNDGVFLSFANGIDGLIPKTQVSVDAEELTDFGMSKFQAVSAKVIKIDYRGATPRFWLTMRNDVTPDTTNKSQRPEKEVVIPDIVEPVDSELKRFAELTLGKVTKARITSIKETQINVELAKDIQGRIDVSEVFDQWDGIKDRKQPLKIFSTRQTIPVRVLGAHDTRNHRFLPLSHRSGKHTVFELTAKSSSIKAAELDILTISDLKPGSSHLAYVNNYSDTYLMVNITPSIRGRIRAVDVSDDLSLAADLATNFPVGSAIRVKIVSVDIEKNRLDLTGRSSDSSQSLTFDDIAAGMSMPGRITKISDRSLLVQLGTEIVGAVDLIDMADDYSEANPAKYQKNEIVRVMVLSVDKPNKKIALSMRPSKILSSSLPVEDREIVSAQHLNVNDIVRGFIKNVSDKGVFVALGHGVTAFVRVTNLSDSYLKEWKDSYQKDQLVKGKVVAVDKDSGHVQMSLKASHINGEYKAPLGFANLAVGDIVTAKVAKVESFGVFIVVDNSEKVRGLCHRSEIADKRIEDVTKLGFNEGDIVKAKVLKVEPEKRRVNFGMKASYFADEMSEDDSDDISVAGSAEDMNDEEISGGMELDVDLDDEEMDDEDDEMLDEAEQDDEDLEADEAPASESTVAGLSVGGFDWTGASSLPTTKEVDLPSNQATSTKKAKKRKSSIQIDRTGDLDTNGPQSTDDFERLLLGEPDSALLWLQYMAFHLDLGDIDSARSIGTRALSSISMSLQAEKQIIWIALLNLENTHGTPASLEKTFQDACIYNDAQEMHTRLISIYIQSTKHSAADDLFTTMVKKFPQDPKVWTNYAVFLFDTLHDAERARALLPRALVVLPAYTHLELTSKFAALEFKSDAGLAERGRTIFEGLINSFPKRVDLFNVLLDLETKAGETEQIRALFERLFSSERKLKPKQARFFFKRWLEFEESMGNLRMVEEVKARAARWVKAEKKDEDNMDE